MTTELAFVAVAALSTLAVACLTFAMYCLQLRQLDHDRKVADANYRFALYEQRLDVYFTVQEFFSGFMRDGHPSHALGIDVLRKTANAKFIFGDDVNDFMTELWKRTVSYKRHDDLWEPLRDRRWRNDPTLTEDDEALLERHFANRQEQLDWFVNAHTAERAEKLFGRYLKLEDALRYRNS